MVSAPARGYRLAPAEERAKRYERGLEAVGLGEHDLRTALRQALQAVGHPAAALTLVASQARTNPALDAAITLAMRQATWRQIVREELCGETSEPIG